MLMLRELRFRRSVHCCTERKVQLHAFADSSGVTYCAVIYVRLCVFMGLVVIYGQQEVVLYLRKIDRHYDWSF